MKSLLLSLILLVAFQSSYALLTTPTLNSPANNATGLTSGVRLDVKNSNGTSYVFEYSESSSMTNPIRLEVSMTAFNTRVWLNKLKLSTDYYWRAKAKKTTDSSNWTSVWKFTTDSVLHRLYPSGYGTVYGSSALYFSSYRAATYDSVEFQLDTSSTFSSSQLRQIYIPDTFQSYYTETFQNNFLYGANYYWRVRAYSSSGSGGWSDTGYFKTFDSIVPKTPLSSGLYDVAVEFEWQSGSSSEGFQVQLDTSSSFNSPSLIDTVSLDGLGSSANPFKAINLLYESTYYYRVRAINPNDSSMWVTRSFSTKSFVTDFTKMDAYIDPKSTVEVLNKIKGSTGYQIQLDLSNSFNTSNLIDLHTATGMADLDTLLFGETYYVRSRPYHSKDTGDWSKVRTTNVLIFPSTYYPYNNYTNIQIKDSLVFSTRIGIDGFQMQVSEDPTFTSSMFLDTTMIGLAYFDDPAVKGHTFKFNKVYYWRMRCWHTADTSVWSSNKKFSTATSPPLLKPVNSNFLGTDVNTTLEWEGLKEVNQYRILLDTASGFNSGALLDTIVSGVITYDLTQLYYDQLYFWKVQALTSDDTSDWSETWNFNTYSVRLTDPKNNITNLSLTSLDWASIKGSKGYILELDSNINFNNPFVATDTVANSFFHYFTDLPALITFNTKYYWRVKLYHEKDTSNWSFVWNFTTKPRRAPTLLSPVDSSTAVSVVPSLMWNAYSGAASYAVEYSENEDFTNAVKVSSSTTTAKVVLKANTTYYWHVRGKNSSNQEFYDWSETWHFTTSDGIPAVVLTSPSDKTTDTKTTLTLEWEKREEAASYQVELSTTSDFSSKQQKSSTVTSYQFSNLLYDTEYFWRVRAINGSLIGDWSEVWSFTTEQDKSGVSDAVKHQVNIYPNPASGDIIIDCSNNDFIPTEIHSMLGEMSMQISDTSPFSKTKVDISSLPSGVYIIHFKNDSNRFSKVLIVD